MQRPLTEPSAALLAALLAALSAAQLAAVRPARSAASPPAPPPQLVRPVMSREPRSGPYRPCRTHPGGPRRPPRSSDARLQLSAPLAAAKARIGAVVVRVVAGVQLLLSGWIHGALVVVRHVRCSACTKKNEHLFSPP